MMTAYNDTHIWMAGTVGLIFSDKPLLRYVVTTASMRFIGDDNDGCITRTYHHCQHYQMTTMMMVMLMMLMLMMMLLLLMMIVNDELWIVQ